MTDPTTLTDFLNLALAAGVPAEALERAGFSRESSMSPKRGGGTRWRFLGRPIESSHLPEPHRTAATLAAERVVIEWLGTLDYYEIPNGTEWRVVKIVHDENGCNAVLHWVTSLHPTLSAALTAALRQIKEARDA